jgi:hypothetical protein
MMGLRRRAVSRQRQTHTCPVAPVHFAPVDQLRSKVELRLPVLFLASTECT